MNAKYKTSPFYKITVTEKTLSSLTLNIKIIHPEVEHFYADRKYLSLVMKDPFKNGIIQGNVESLKVAGFKIINTKNYPRSFDFSDEHIFKIEELIETESEDAIDSYMQELYDVGQLRLHDKYKMYVETPETLNEVFERMLMSKITDINSISDNVMLVDNDTVPEMNLELWFEYDEFLTAFSKGTEWTTSVMAEEDCFGVFHFVIPVVNNDKMKLNEPQLVYS